jgi:hypothetical protein
MNIIKMLEAENSVKKITAELMALDDFALPALAMVVEGMAKENNMPLMTLYGKLIEAAGGVVNKYGDII